MRRFTILSSILLTIAASTAVAGQACDNLKYTSCPGPMCYGAQEMCRMEMAREKEMNAYREDSAKKAAEAEKAAEAKKAEELRKQEEAKKAAGGKKGKISKKAEKST